MKAGKHIKEGRVGKQEVGIRKMYRESKSSKRGWNQKSVQGKENETKEVEIKKAYTEGRVSIEKVGIGKMHRKSKSAKVG